MNVIQENRLNNFLDAISAWRAAGDHDYGKEKKCAWERVEAAAELYVEVARIQTDAVNAFLFILGTKSR